MKSRKTSKVFRIVLIAGVLAASLVTGGTYKGTSARATDCVTAWNDYLDASYAHEIARLSYFFGIPTTCAEECSNNPTCISNCNISRNTTRANAELGMFSYAYETCTPLTIDACAEANNIYNGCIAVWQAETYGVSDPDELASAGAKLLACREASKIDACQ